MPNAFEKQKKVSSSVKKKRSELIINWWGK